MELTQEVEVAKPIEEVTAVLSDPATARAWHRDLKRETVKRGTAGQPGAVTELAYTEKGRSFKLEEELVTADLPRAMVAIYKGPGMKHRLTTSLEAIDAGHTKVTVHNDIKLSGMAKLAGPVIGAGTRGQMETRARDLKQYLETGAIG